MIKSTCPQYVFIFVVSFISEAQNMVLPEKYRKRLADDRISAFLGSFGTVCVYGPFGSGVTTTAFRHTTDCVSPRLLDDCFEFPGVFNAAVSASAATWKNGLFIAATSGLPDFPDSTFSKERTSFVRMSTMSLFETGDSSGQISLSGLFQREIPEIQVEPQELNQIYSYCIRGGWPQFTGAVSYDISGFGARYINRTADSLDDTKSRQKREKVLGLIRALAQIESSVFSVTDCLNIVNSDPGLSLSRNTLLQYLNAFDSMLFTEDQPAFIPETEVSRVILKSPKRRFADPSLVAAALDATHDSLGKKPVQAASLFDCLCVHDLRVYADFLGAKIYHYRDNYGVSADSVLRLPDGRWGAFKHMLCLDNADSAAQDLLKLKAAFSSTPDSPSFLCILCGTSDKAYTRADGVMVIPVTALRP